MEKKFFDWEDWNQFDLMVAFYNCCLKVPIGTYPVGYVLQCITINYDEGTLDTYEEVNGEEISNTFNLNLSISE